jgi:hypothetical protein
MRNQTQSKNSNCRVPTPKTGYLLELRQKCGYHIIAYRIVPFHFVPKFISISPLLDVNLVDLSPLLLGLGDSDDQDTVLHLSRDAQAINLIALVGSHRRQRHGALKQANLAFAGGKGVEEGLVARAMYDTSNLEKAAVGVPVDANVLLLCAGEGDVDDVRLFGVEDVDGWVEGGV